MQVAAFEQWVANRPFLLPDDEETQLKFKLHHAEARALVDAVRRMRRQQVQQRARRNAYLERCRGSQHPSKMDAAANSSVSAFSRAALPDDVLSDETALPIHTLDNISPSLRTLIFSFLPVISNKFVDDLRHAHAVLALQDGEVLRIPAKSASMVETMITRIIDTHIPSTGDFALIALSMGLHASAAASHPQRVEYCQLIGDALCELRVLQHRVEAFGNWTEYRDALMQETCTAVRATLREELLEWGRRMRAWGEQRKDIMYELATSELQFLWKRCTAIEYIGNPALEIDDVRNMLWDCDAPMPQGVTAEYTQSITVQSAVTLGLTELRWVRGFVWEERPIPLDSEDVDNSRWGTPCDAATSGSPVGGQCSPAMTAVSSATSAETVARLTCQKQQQQLSQQRQHLEVLEGERVMAQQEEQVLRGRAWQVAANGMTQRLWMTTQQFRHRWHHRFCGCEICASLPIHHVGLRRENSGASDDIALCSRCFDELYADERSVVHRMYMWYIVKDLIDDPAGNCGVSEEVPQQSPQSPANTVSEHGMLPVTSVDFRSPSPLAEGAM